MKSIRTACFAVIFLITAASLFGCSSSKSEDSMDNSGYSPETSMATTYRENDSGSKANTGDGLGDIDLGEKMIYTGRISIETLEFDKTLKELEAYVLSLGGFVESSSISGVGEKYDGSSTVRGYAEIIYRIPAGQYSGFMDNIHEYGNVVSKGTASENITSSYYDVEGRLKAYRIAETRLLEILGKANEVKDMLEIERELTNVRANIESMTTQLKAWDNLVSYSKVIIMVREVKRITDVSEPDSFGSKLIQTIKKSFVGFMDFIKGAIIIVVYIIPYAVILGLIAFLVLKGRGLINRKKKTDTQKKE